MRIKISELSIAALNWAVAEAQGVSYGRDISGAITATRVSPVMFFGTLTTRYKKKDDFVISPGGSYSPATEPAQAYPIISANGISTKYSSDGKHVTAFIDRGDPVEQTGPTLLIAAMRCFAVYRLGLEIEVPDESLGIQK